MKYVLFADFDFVLFANNMLAEHVQIGARKYFRMYANFKSKNVSHR